MKLTTEKNAYSVNNDLLVLCELGIYHRAMTESLYGWLRRKEIKPEGPSPTTDRVYRP